MKHCSGCSWLGIHAAGCPPITERGSSGEDCNFHANSLDFALTLPIEDIRANQFDFLIFNGMMREQ